MNKNDIITWLYKLDVVRKYGYNYLKKFTSSQLADLVLEVYLHICEIPEDKLIDLYKQGEKHLTAYIRLFVIFLLHPNGQTRDTQKMFTTEVPTDFDTDRTYDDEDDKKSSKKYFIDNKIDSEFE